MPWHFAVARRVYCYIHFITSYDAKLLFHISRSHLCCCAPLFITLLASGRIRQHARMRSPILPFHFYYDARRHRRSIFRRAYQRLSTAARAAQKRGAISIYHVLHSAKAPKSYHASHSWSAAAHASPPQLMPSRGSNLLLFVPEFLPP